MSPTLTYTVAALLVKFLTYTLYIMALSFILWMAVDAGKNDKFWWIVIIVGVPGIGALVYFFVEKKGDYMKLFVGK